MIQDAPNDGVVPIDCVTLTRAAADLKITRQRVHRLVADGRLDVIRVAGAAGAKPQYWIRIEDLEAFKAARNS